MERRSSYRALIVEDDGAILNLVKIVLERENFSVEGVGNAAAAIDLLASVAYDLLIVDLMLPEIGARSSSAFSRDVPAAPSPSARASAGKSTTNEEQRHL